MLIAGPLVLDMDCGFNTGGVIIKSAGYEIIDKTESTISTEKNALGPNPKIGKSFFLRTPDNDNLKKNVNKITLYLKFAYTASPEQNQQAEWVFKHPHFPGPVSLTLVILPVSVFVLLGIAILLFLKNRETPPPAIDLEQEEDTVKPLFPVKAPSLSAGNENGLKTALLKVHDSENTPEEIGDGEVLALSPEDNIFGRRLWDIGCPGNILEFRKGRIFLNNTKQKKGKDIVLEKPDGEKITLKITI